MRRLIILNPASRHGAAKKTFVAQKAMWRELLGEFEVYHTTGPGDATREVTKVLRNRTADQILIAGGDGSINEAARGYWHEGKLIRNDVPLGIINLGTGGDFYKSVTAASENYEEALVENRFTRIDSALVRDNHHMERTFINISSVGLAGEMLGRLKASSFQRGAAAYFYHTLRSLISFAPREVTVVWEDEQGATQTRDTELINGFVCNGRYSGGGMQWAPLAELNDGLLRITLITGRRKLPLILQSGKLYSGKIEKFPGAETFAAKRVRFCFKSQVSLETDGEPVAIEKEGPVEFEFSVVAKSFPLVL
ncbi:diacylglycerol kinase family protein [Verrucomicrobiales bacterium BCK34]|nr:diacylglycerol kinase family protein [Verrucomicrobiales bacterium BCK34]